jgi:hypothetical protein
VLTDVEVQARKLRSLQAAANEHLEEAFVCANLLVQEEEEPEPETEDLDMAQEYEAFCRKLESVNDETFEDAAPPLDMTGEHLQVAPPSEEEQARQNVINALWASKETLDQARRDFEERDIRRAQELNANKVAAENGESTSDDSPEDFDVRRVQRYREISLRSRSATAFRRHRDSLRSHGRRRRWARVHDFARAGVGGFGSFAGCATVACKGAGGCGCGLAVFGFACFW